MESEESYIRSSEAKEKFPKPKLSGKETNRKQVIVILGCTGTGKSKLAIEIALHLREDFNIEIVNSDVLQMYKGLDIVTNKVSKEEQNAVVHHMMSFLEIEEEFNSSKFLKIALPLISGLVNERRTIPIIVGGTHYYIESLLWENHLMENVREITDSLSECEEYCRKASEINKSNESISTKENCNAVLESGWSFNDSYETLTTLDPDLAKKLHPHDIRKIKRAIELTKETGVKYSILAKEKSKEEKLRFDTCFLWIDCENSILEKRLESRIDQMMHNGLLDELHGLFQQKQDRHQKEGNHKSSVFEEIDWTKGIFQAIGCRDFLSYFQASHLEENGLCPIGTSNATESLLEECISALKSRTRKYARSQRKWVKRIHSKLLRGESKYAYWEFHRLDSSDSSSWSRSVLQPAIAAVRDFLNRKKMSELQSPGNTGMIDLSEGDILSQVFYTHDNNSNNKEWEKYVCNDCQRTLNGQHEWEVHRRSKRHKAIVKGKRKKLRSTASSIR